MNIKRLFRINGSILLGLTIILIWSLFGPPILTRAASYTVCPTGPPTCDYSSVQSAVDAAGAGDVIKVAAGTYTGINNKGGLAQVVYLDKSVTIRGGYTTTNWTTPDPVTNPTTIDAQGGGRVLYITGSISPTIEGLRITGGDATVLGNGGNGGGIYISDAVATIRNNYVLGNTADIGGGLHLDSSDATLIGNTIITNNVNDAGGGLYLSDCDANLSSNTIHSNTAPHGGGLYLMHSDATLNGNTIISNIADSQGGGVWLDFSDATLTNNLVADNRANSEGSGLYVWTSSPRLLHTTVARNSGGDGSGLYITDDGSNNSDVTLTNTILVGQMVGIYVENGNIASLEATLWGSGAWANGTDWAGSGTIVTTANLLGNPDFVDPDAGDYHIGSNSDAIDQGVDAGVTNDIDNHTRPYQEPDIGADEFWPPGDLKFIYLPIIIR